MVSIQLQRHETGLYTEHGLTVNQVSASYGVDLQEFTPRGTPFVRLRDKIARAARAGLTVVEVGLDQWADAVAAVDRVWLASKREGAKEPEFLVGECGGPRRLTAGRSPA
ncbi:hypothetical protein GCM10023324_34230 [Streptomyces youssoufiensis]